MPSTPADQTDPSNGWEAVAREFIENRPKSSVGVATVLRWARSLPPGASVLDLGCGSGMPISQALMRGGFDVYGVDASPSMAQAFRQRFPEARVVCEPVERSTFFGKTFDGAVAWGLMFLLREETQRALIQRVGAVLGPGGRFLFTAPSQVCTWADNSTGRTSLSLGAAAYTAELAAAGLSLVDEYVDEGENHYYAAVKP